MSVSSSKCWRGGLLRAPRPPRPLRALLALHLSPPWPHTQTQPSLAQASTWTWALARPPRQTLPLTPPRGWPLPLPWLRTLPLTLP